ncbi:MAG: ABC transporter permease [Paludibacteraceae bacterium]
MNFEYYIAKRIHFEQQGKRNVSRPAVRVATIGIAVGLAVMIISVSVIIGFKKEIREKTIGFSSHIQITNFDTNNTYETAPVTVNDTLIGKIINIPEVSHIQHYATKPGIIKTDEEFQGIVMKGISNNFDWNFFKANLIEGDILQLNDSVPKNEAIISKSMADLLKLKLGDSFITYFLQDDIRARKLKITGIYLTNFAEYDQLFVLTDVRIVQKLNNWKANQYSGIEVQIKDFGLLDKAYQATYDACANRFDEIGNGYYITTIKQINPQIFSWLALLDMNVWIILFLMLIVAGFNIISGLLILILERVNMIGILKSYGATDWSIRKIFLYHLLFLIGKGIFWGNIIGLAICSIQYFFHIIPLDPVSYYVSTVPITFNWGYIVLLNIGTLAASMLMLVGPSYLITKISPAKTVRYE